MRVVFVDLSEEKAILDVEAGSVAPAVNDIVVHPGLGNFRVMQRAFIMEEKMSKIITKDQKKTLEVFLQVALLPLTEEE